MWILAQRSEPVAAIIIMLVVGFVVALIALHSLRERLFPRQIANRLRRFFGRREFARLETHDKSFPAYDLVSINRALQSYFEEFCEGTRTIGSVQAATFRDILADGVVSWIGKSRPQRPSYERLPVDVDREESVVSQCVYFTQAAVASEAAPDHRVKLAVMLSYTAGGGHVGDDFEGNAVSTAGGIKVSVASTAQHAADHLFRELEMRRRRFSIYRGKVIEPTVSEHGIASISFARVAKVSSEDLVLPDSVRQLVQGSIVAFYEHRDALRKLGVEMKRGVLFHSPPGTGKTSISLYLASFLPDFTICFISGRKLMYPRELCAMGRYLQPAMLVFEDIDLIASERDQNGLATVLGELMNQIDGCGPDEQLLFIMNTNSMDRIERAVRNRPGRVDQIIQIPLPDEMSRRKLIQYFAHDSKIDASDVEAVARQTTGATPAMLKEVVKRAAVYGLQRLAAAKRSNGETPVAAPLRLTRDDLLLAYEQILDLRDPEAPQRIGFQ